MKQIITFLCLLPLTAFAQQSEFSIGIGSSYYLSGQPLNASGRKNFPISPNAQASYMRQIGKNYQVGISTGLSFYPLSAASGITDGVDAPPATITAIPVRLEARHNLIFDKSRLQLGLNAGVVLCPGNTPGPFSGPHPWAVPHQVPVGFKHSMAVTAGAMIGFDHAVSNKLRLGIAPGVNVISGPLGKEARSSMLDMQLRVNCSYTCTKTRSSR